jgi:hypothetical protein
MKLHRRDFLSMTATEVLMVAYRSIVEERPVPLPLESGANPLVGERTGV